MLAEPDGLTCDQVREVVATGWALPIERCEYLPAGLGAHHWLGWPGGSAHPMIGSGKPHASWFITADAGQEGRRTEAAYTAARALADAGLQFVLAPMRAVSGRVVVPAGDWTFSVTRYIPGHSGPGPFADDRQRTDVAALLGRLHAAPPPAGTPRLDLPRSWPGTDAALADLNAAWQGGPLAEAARTLLRANAASVRNRLADHARRCAALLPGDEPWVLSHGEHALTDLRRYLEKR